MVVFRHLEIRTDWLSVTSIWIGWEGESWFSMSHLLPSNSFFGGAFGFSETSLREEAVEFWRMLGGLGLISGPGLLLREMSLSEAEGTTLEVRRLGFLCVIWDLSTFLRPEVTDSPLLSWAKTAFMSVAPAWDPDGVGPGGGGGAELEKSGSGGGGGGGAPVPPLEDGVWVWEVPLMVEESKSMSR